MNIYCDSDMNILDGLRHESCEAHCDECGTCDWENIGPTTVKSIPMVSSEGVTLCPDCADDYS